ncbi:MAG: hypothetical protein WBC06_09735 [Chitinophagaceae bacterium]
MAINKNHEFEELNGVKCGIVEKNVNPERLIFLKELLEYNGCTVIAVPSPAPKAAPAPKPAEGEAAPAVEIQANKPETFTVGVTDYTYNTINAIFGRQLKTRDGHIVTLAYWQQKEASSHDEIPYYENI